MNKKKQNNGSGDEDGAPENWEYYAGMLREYRDGVAPPDSLRVPASTELFDNEIRRRRRKGTQRWLLGMPVLALVMLVAGTILHRSYNGAAAPVAQQHQEVNDPVALEAPEDLFAAPEIPPVWIDSDLEAIELPGFPGIDMELADSTFNIDAIIDTPAVAGE